MPDQDQVVKGNDEKFCSSCGAVIKKEAEICPKCGVRQMAAPGKQKAEPKTYSTKSKVWWGILSAGLLIGAFASLNVPKNTALLFVPLFLSGLLVNPLLNKMFAKIKILNVPSIRLILSVAIGVLIGMNLSGPSIPSDFQKEYDELGSPKIMYQCGDDIAYSAGVGIAATYNHLVDEAKRKCGGKEFKILQSKQ
jgi:predicted RNA-binding Zn-ribbon protein involved in translation (DUF1610 family)